MSSKCIAAVTGWLCASAVSCLDAMGAEGTPSAGTGAPWKSGVHHLVFDGLERTFILDAPRRIKPGAPLVMVFHGFGSSAGGIRDLAGFTALIEPKQPRRSDSEHPLHPLVHWKRRHGGASL